MSIDGISTTVNIRYAPPNITSVISPPFKGGTVQIAGIHFGNSKDKISVAIDEDGCAAKACTNVQLTSGIQCLYNQQGSFGACRGVIVTVDGQQSNRLQYCYDVDKGELNGLPVGVQRLSENQNLSYAIGVSVAPTANIQVSLSVVSTDTKSCFASPSELTFGTGTVTAQNVIVSTQGNVIDEGTDAVTYACQIKHTVSSTDPQYSTHPVSIVDINIINDDQADVKLWTVDSDTGTYDYDVKFVGPLSIVEGTSTTYGVRLDTEPQYDVEIRPNISLKTSTIAFHPMLNSTPSIVFGKSNWNIIQPIRIFSIQDLVDNDNMRFQIVHHIKTDDKILYDKATVRPIMTVLDVVDDDTAGIVYENDLMQLDEGKTKSFMITSFATRPLKNVRIVVEAPSMLVVYPITFVVAASEWQSIDRQITVSALDGTYTETNFAIQIRSTSSDPKYNLNATKSVVVATKGLIEGTLSGLPVGVQEVAEATNLSYSIGLTRVPTATVRLSLEVVETHQALKCFVSPTDIVLESGQSATHDVIVQTQGNTIDEGTNAITYSCQIKHIMNSTDPQYSTHPVSIIDINIINDDQADVKLWTIDDAGRYTYDVKFVGPLSALEGGSVAYGVRLDTEPQFPVIVQPNITLTDGAKIESPPMLASNPIALIFGKSNWSLTQRIDLVSIQDNVDNDNEQFKIVHHIKTDDKVLYDKATVRPIMTVLDVVDDDTAGIVYENDLMQLDEGKTKSFMITSFATRPLKNVRIVVEAPSMLVVYPITFVVAASEWQSIDRQITVSALDGTYTETNFAIQIRSTSSDPKYNLNATKSVVVAPKTEIIPGLIGVPQDSLAVEGGDFQYKLTLSVAPTQAVSVKIIADNCQLQQPEEFTPANWNEPLNILVSTKDDDKFYARFFPSYVCRISHTFETQDPLYATAASASFDLTVTSSGCGLNEYIKRDNSSLCQCQANYYLPPNSNCVQCPPVVSACDTIGLLAPPVAPGYWRYDPTSPDVVRYPFFRCPMPSCVGGNSTVGRCKIGHGGPLCATCIEEYAFYGKECISCPGRKSNRSFSWQIVLLTVAFCLVFMGCTFWFLTEPAMTKKDMNDLRSSMKDIKMRKKYIKQQSFEAMVKKRNKSFVSTQINQAFEMIDLDKTGKINKEEFDKWLNKDDTMDKWKDMAVNAKSVKEVDEILKLRASSATLSMWNASLDTLLSLENMLFNIDAVFDHLKIDLKAFDVDFFVKFEVDLTKMKRLLKDILEAFIKNMDEAEHLFHMLNKLFSELKALLNGLVFFELQIPKGLAEIELFVRDMFAEIQAALYDKMQLLERFMIKFPNLYQVIFRVPNLGGWIMKLKIFIGFIQCFCYFPVIFDIPWAPNILAFMELMEFDFLVIFGDFSCYMQLGFLEKFVYHMLIFPAVIGMILLVVLVTKCKQWRPKYTTASVSVQALTLASLSAFTLYTGVVSRVFRLFKCFKIEETWYLTSDYNIKFMQGS
eukprot:g11566.t1